MTSKAAAAIEEMALRDHPNSACHNGMASAREPRTVKAKASVTKPSATTLQPLGNRRSADDHDVGIAGYFQSNSAFAVRQGVPAWRSEEHTSEIQSLMINPYVDLCMQKKKK